ncbi:MAG: hypothetical protein ACYC2K_00250 [Gemmatimonadales bacterium]
MTAIGGTIEPSMTGTTAAIETIGMTVEIGTTEMIGEGVVGIN